MAKIEELLEIMSRLRDPKSGCPWDVKQNFASIAGYTVEEAYEVADAILKNDMENLREELGDLLLQVVFHAQMAKEQGIFDFSDVVGVICLKMIERHPHVFGDANIKTAEEQVASWEEIKRRKRQEIADAKGIKPSLLDDVPVALPAMQRADKLQKKASSVGFDWSEHTEVLDKLDEELEELENSIEQDEGKERLSEEMGDVLFCCVNLARHLGIDPEEALRKTNAKFEQRFRFIENHLANAGETFEDKSLEDLDELWDNAKAAEAILKATGR